MIKYPKNNMNLINLNPLTFKRKMMQKKIIQERIQIKAKVKIKRT